MASKRWILAQCWHSKIACFAPMLFEQELSPLRPLVIWHSSAQLVGMRRLGAFSKVLVNARLPEK
jgi:hypothetical protein